MAAGLSLMPLARVAAAQTAAPPMISVILNTYNRAALLSRAVKSVLAQTHDDFELVVADDGSTDRTPAVVAEINDRRVRYVRQDNAGLSAARNFGVGSSLGRYVTFLDDDDEVLPGWLEAFDKLISSSGCGVACCGAEVVHANKTVTDVRKPHNLGAPFNHCIGLFHAGTFAVRRDVFDAIDGYATGIPCHHQTEFALRLVPWCSDHGLPVTSVPQALLRIHRAQETARRRSDPERFLAGTRYILEHHGNRLGRSKVALANYLGSAGVSSARLGRYADARRYFYRAVRAHPTLTTGYGLLMISMVPTLGDHVWKRKAFQQETPWIRRPT
ncbi:MAG TPA: glycosyltransferase family 2 protein [Solirubrobacteraceae bacterium]